MWELVNQAIAAQLEPLMERISELESQLEEKDRLSRGLIRLGKVSKHSDDKRKIKVKFGENETPFIKWFSACSGEVSEYRLPSIGENAVLLNIAGGDNSSMTLALIGVPSDQYPLPTNNPDETLRVYPDKTSVKYNHKTHKLTVDVKSGEAEIIIPKKTKLDTKLLHVTGDIKADGDITDHTRSMQDDRTIYNSHDHPHGDPNTSVPNQSK